MPSRSLQIWQTTRAAALDEIEAAHRAVGRGVGRGRRYATQQINQAYVVLLSFQFQGFCRELHDESAAALVHVLPPAIGDLVADRLAEGRTLDRGNPNPGNLGSDFRRFGLWLWEDVIQLDRRNAARQTHFEDLSKWRNAIAHQSFDATRLGGRKEIGLADIRRWRRDCNALARAFDTVVKRALVPLVGSEPW